jgi:hypothetical protein
MFPADLFKMSGHIKKVAREKIQEIERGGKTIIYIKSCLRIKQLPRMIV